MKEIKAYIRPERVDKVISELELAGAKGMTIINVAILGKWADPKKSIISLEYCDKYCSSVKIELVCIEDNAEKFIKIIEGKAHTGQRGDGKIFVSNILDAVSIRTGERGSVAL